MAKIIRFAWESEKHIRVSKAGNENSLFYESYRQALAGIIEIIRNSALHCTHADPIFPRTSKDQDMEDEYGSDPDYYNYPSNLLVFSGERGAGKSSALLTFAKSLTDKHSPLFSFKFIREVTKCELPSVDTQLVKTTLEQCAFHVLPPIDPTTLESKGGILLTILARMFQKANDAWEMQGNGYSKIGPEQIQKKNELMKQFSICYDHLRAIKDANALHPEFAGLETLAELGDSTRFKKELTVLVERLLQFCSGTSRGVPYLVLQIDDTDMNISHAYTILEDIRKYLVIPCVIILMAADLNHLKTVIESNLVKLYPVKRGIGSQEITAITQQYMIKLFPQTRQIYLPVLGTYLKEHTDNVVIEYRTPKGIVLPERAYETDNMQDGIIRLIYKKTGIAFLREENALHSMIPENMRQMAHFLSMLVQMEDVEDPDKDDPSFFLDETILADTRGGSAQEIAAKYLEHIRKIRSRLHNVERFHDYFLHTWVGYHLNESDKQKLYALERIDLSKKCRYAVSFLAGDQPADRATFYKDVIVASKRYESEYLVENGAKFTFAIRVYFTLLAHIIVLQTLIEFYDQEKGENADYFSDYRLPFPKLYYLFGASPFAYRRIENEPNDDSIIAVSEWQLPLQWMTEMSIPFENPYLSGLAMYLHAMLPDYKTEDDTPFLLRRSCYDLCNPIVNCLYMGDYSSTPRYMRKYRANWSTVKIEPNRWRKLRNSALISILNLEIYEKINQNTVRSSMNQIEKLEKSYIDFWLMRLHAFYKAILPAHQENAQEPIKAIHKVNYSEWAFCLNPDEIKKTKLTVEEKKSLVSLLDQLYIDYIDMPDEDSPETSEQEPLLLEDDFEDFKDFEDFEDFKDIEDFDTDLNNFEGTTEE